MLYAVREYSNMKGVQKFSPANRHYHFLPVRSTNSFNSANMSPDLLLDPQLKYWVLLPISFVMVLVGILRANVTQLMSGGPKLTPFKKFREQSFLGRVGAFRANNSVLTEQEFQQRQEYFIATLNTDHFYSEPISEDDKPANPFTDPSTNDAMMNMMKGNLMNYIPQTLIMGWINYFFAGFVIMKLPFPLTDSFKQMLQNGVATPDLNVRYVSSISWYFVNLLGLRPIYTILLQDSSAVDALMQQQSQTQQVPTIGGPGGPKVDKVYKAEAENLQVVDHKSIFDGIVERVLEAN